VGRFVFHKDASLGLTPAEDEIHFGHPLF